MNRIQEALATAGALVLVHAALCVYLFLRRMPGNSRKRGLILVIGNCVLLLVFYIPARLVPNPYTALFAAGFLLGFFLLVRYIKRMRDRETPRE